MAPTSLFPSVLDVLSRLFSSELALSAFPVYGITPVTGKCSCGKEKCTSPGKHPYGGLLWKKSAVKTLQDFLRLVPREKNTHLAKVNIGVATGQQNLDGTKFLCVIDVDGPEAHKILKKKYSVDKVPTLSYTTGSGSGHHYWFWHTKPFSNSVSRFEEKIDIRGIGGYVIVPPSSHKSGNKYSFPPGTDLTSLKILDMPQNIVERLECLEKTKGQKRVSEKTETTLPGNVDLGSKAENSRNVPVFKPAISWWSEVSIKTMKSYLVGKTKIIPSGVRNNVLFRLLCSDRAIGAQYAELLEKSKTYVSYMESPKTFSVEEQMKIVRSVIRYPAYNTRFENVNKNYVAWVKKNLPPPTHSNIFLSVENLDKIDLEFFGLLRKISYVKNKKLASYEVKPVKLKEISVLRSTWISKMKNINKHAKFKPQLLGKKLVSLGFDVQHTSSGNVWFINLQGVHDDMVSVNVVDTNKERDKVLSVTKPTEKKEEINMSSENTASDETPTTPDSTAAARAPLGPDGNPMTLVEEREDVIEAKRKYNPNDDHYRGQEDSQEWFSSWMKWMEKLTPAQLALYKKEKLVSNEADTKAWMNSLVLGDVVGLKFNIYKVKKITDKGLNLVRLVYNKAVRKMEFSEEVEKMTIAALDEILGVNAVAVKNNGDPFAEILYRDDKPFGLEQDLSYKVKVTVWQDSSGKQYAFQSHKQNKVLPDSTVSTPTP